MISWLKKIDVRSVAELVSTSRHSAVPALRRLSPPGVPTFTRRVLALAAGSTLIGVAVALLVEADLGLAPYDVLASGVARHTDLTLGQSGWVIATTLFLIAWIMGRRVQPWGVVYILANGAAVDAASGVLNGPDSLVLRLGFVAGAILTMAAGVSLVVFSTSTGGPFELIMLAVEDRGGSRIRTRYVLDASVLGLGILLGGSFGIATVVFAALMGLTLVVVHQALADHRAGRLARLDEHRESVLSH